MSVARSTALVWGNTGRIDVDVVVGSRRGLGLARTGTDSRVYSTSLSLYPAPTAVRDCTLSESDRRRPLLNLHAGLSVSRGQADQEAA